MWPFAIAGWCIGVLLAWRSGLPFRDSAALCIGPSLLALIVRFLP